MSRVCRSCCGSSPCASGTLTLSWSLCGTTPPAAGTVALKLGGTTIATSTMDQGGTPGYTQFTGLSPGTYTVVGTQPGCLTYTSSPITIDSACDPVSTSYTLTPDATHICCGGQLVAYTYYWTDPNGTFPLAWNGCFWQGCGITASSLTTNEWGNLPSCVCSTVSRQVPYVINMYCYNSCSSLKTTGSVDVVYFNAQNCPQTGDGPTWWDCATASSTNPYGTFPGTCSQYSRSINTSTNNYNLTTGGVQTMTFLAGSISPVCGAAPYAISP